MNTKTIVAMILIAAAVGAIGPTVAKEIKANSKESGKAFSDCAKNGGTNWSSTNSDNPNNLTYGCIDKNGHGLVCGGGTAEQQKTCSTFRTKPPFPTREEAVMAGKK